MSNFSFGGAGNAKLFLTHVGVPSEYINVGNPSVYDRSIGGNIVSIVEKEGDATKRIVTFDTPHYLTNGTGGPGSGDVIKIAGTTGFNGDHTVVATSWVDGGSSHKGDAGYYGVSGQLNPYSVEITSSVAAEPSPSGASYSMPGHYVIEIDDSEVKHILGGLTVPLGLAMTVSGFHSGGRREEGSTVNFARMMCCNTSYTVADGMFIAMIITQLKES